MPETPAATLLFQAPTFQEPTFSAPANTSQSETEEKPRRRSRTRELKAEETTEETTPKKRARSRKKASDEDASSEAAQPKRRRSRRKEQDEETPEAAEKEQQHLLVRLLTVRIALKPVKRRLAVVAVVAFAPLKLKREVTRFRRSKDQPASRPRNSAARKGAARDVVTTASPSLNSWLDVSL